MFDAMKRAMLRLVRDDPDESMKDWPAQLRVNAVACELALDIYLAACKVNRLPPGDFIHLSPSVKQQYIWLASNVLRQCLPHQRVS